jgi:lipopolysaccharide heptosyltransferase I
LDFGFSILDCRAAPRFLIVRLSSLGDVVNALPAAHALRGTFPHAFLAWAVDGPLAPLLRRSNLLDEVLPLPVPNGQTVRWDDLLRAPALYTDFRRFVRRLRQLRFDTALELQGLLRSAATAYFSKAPERIGFVDERRELNYVFLSRRVPPRGRHAVDRFLSMAEAAGARKGPPSWGTLIWPEDEAAVDRLLAPLPTRCPLIALNPGASAAYKRWPAERYARAADEICRQGEAVFVVVGSQPERALAQTVCDAANVPLLNLAGRTTLPQLAALLKRCACVLTGDTGPMHLAVAVGTTVVAIMGPTDASITGPYGARNAVIQAGGMQRAAWGQSKFRDPKLMLEIAPEAVTAAARRVLEWGHPPLRACATYPSIAL